MRKNNEKGFFTDDKTFIGGKNYCYVCDCCKKKMKLFVVDEEHLFELKEFEDDLKNGGWILNEQKTVKGEIKTLDFCSKKCMTKFYLNTKDVRAL